MAHCDTEMIDEVDEVLENLNVTSEYRASLAWRSTADLDIYVKITATEELICHLLSYVSRTETHTSMWIKYQALRLLRGSPMWKMSASTAQELMKSLSTTTTPRMTLVRYPSPL